MNDLVRLTPSQEDYLEAIFHIIEEKQGVRAKDIAQRLSVKNASVTGALRALGEKELINYAPYDVITLTPEGRNVAEDVVRRHEVLKDFFSRVLGVNVDNAEKGACEMEHSVPRPILDKLINFVEFLEVCPRVGNDWIEAFSDYCAEKNDPEKCINCATQRLEELKGKQEKENLEGKNIIPLHELEPGRKGKILKVKGKGNIHDRIIEKGFIKGSLLEVETKSDEDTTVDVKIRGYHISLRNDDAEKIIVEVLNRG